MHRLHAQRIERQVRLAGEIAARVLELFAACPELCGFAVDDTLGLPVRVDAAQERLCVREVVLHPCLDGQRYAEVCDEIAQTLAEIVSERPEAGALLCGRTFARALH
ncbi:MAG TPA: hypothetical protein VNE59_12195 [Burkholderiales bacterium]|nr:hypothetical protein [Burkholderiales bacterium]